MARVFLAGLDTSIPHRKVATEFYKWERDVDPADGRLRKRLEKELARDKVVVAVLREGKDGEETVGGYVNWTDPKVEDGVYHPGEVG
jgi:hypothetical protein